MSEDFEREERAFAEALRKDAPVESFLPLDPAAIKAAAGAGARVGRPRWLKGLAAAAAVVIVVGAGAAILPGLVGSKASSVSGMPEVYPAGGVASMDSQDRTTAAAGPLAPAAGWTSTAAWPLSPREDVSAIHTNGRFYVVGGRTPSDCPRGAACPMPSNDKVDGASYNPPSNSWTSLPNSPIVVDRTPPVEVNGTLYYLGTGSSGTRGMAAFDLSANSWRVLPAPRLQSELVGAGDVLVSIGLSNEDEASLDQVFDPSAEAWTDLPRDPLGKSEARSGVWVDGRLLLVSYEFNRKPGEKGWVRIARLDLAGRTWTPVKTIRIDAYVPVAVGGRIVWTQPIIPTAKGGRASNQVIWVQSSGGGGATVERPTSVGGLDGVDRVVAGDRLGVANVDGEDGHLYNFTSGEWELLTAPPQGNSPGQTVVGSPDGLLVVGGSRDGVALDSYYLPLR